MNEDNFEESQKEERNSYYEIDDEKTTAKYMLDSLEKKIVLPTHDDTNFNPFVFRHAMTQDMDITTFLMWMQAFSPLLAGIIVYNVLRRLGIYFIGKFIMLGMLDAIFGLLDVYVLHKHNYDVLGLVFWSVWLPPVYMKKRSKLLREKNYHHIVWLLTAFVLVIM